MNILSNKPPEQEIHKSVLIAAPASRVWHAITSPALMVQWMSQPQMEIISGWREGSEFIIRGPWYKTSFENRGLIELLEHERVFRYSHLSSLSRLPDVAENYTHIEFRLAPEGNDTRLALILSNFPTEAIYKHFAFYWGVTLELLRKFIEGNSF